MRPLTPALAEKARVELNEDPNRLSDDLQHLKDWIAKQPHLRARTDDQWLLTFLRGCKFSLERTKEKFDLYYSVRTAAPELFQVKYPDPVFDTVINDGGFITLPKTVGPDTPRVALGRMGRIDVNKYSIIDIMGTMDLLQKIAFMEDDHLTVAGAIMIIDCEGISMAHVTQMTPTFLKQISVIGQNASPVRMKGVHVINAPTGIETLFNLMKSLIIEKNSNRRSFHDDFLSRKFIGIVFEDNSPLKNMIKFHMHSSFEDLYKHVPKEILPEEYGGNGCTTAEIADYWRCKVKEYKAFLDEEAYFGTDEYKRPGKPRTAEDMFGADGSFRKLEVD